MYQSGESGKGKLRWFSAIYSKQPCWTNIGVGMSRCQLGSIHAMLAGRYTSHHRAVIIYQFSVSWQVKHAKLWSGAGMSISQSLSMIWYVNCVWLFEKSSWQSFGYFTKNHWSMKSFVGNLKLQVHPNIC